MRYGLKSKSLINQEVTNGRPNFISTLCRFFYFMMRFGCGAHMAHGHHSHSKSDKAQAITDPVCGKVVDQKQGYGKLH